MLRPGLVPWWLAAAVALRVATWPAPPLGLGLARVSSSIMPKTAPGTRLAPGLEPGLVPGPGLAIGTMLAPGLATGPGLAPALVSSSCELWVGW